ncbi:MAG TPA: hypothetical protein VJN43_12430 [Bryobacteraceae bacterium]|nr:hypothetical protein [Bryobacteraceae bacterium]
MRALSAVVFAVFVASYLSAQSGVAVVGAGYVGPNNVITVAPGQITTFFLSGAGVTLPAPARIDARGPAVPTSLGGFSATIRQTLTNTLFSLPILSVKQTNICVANSTGFPGSGCTITSLTVQIPNGLAVHNPIEVNPFFEFGATELIISVDGVASSAFALEPVATQIHMLTNCDGSPVANFGGLPCTWQITHANGSVVAWYAPAKPGETVVAYAFGLGAPGSQVVDGVPVRTSVALKADQFQLSFAYRAGGSVPPIEAPPDLGPAAVHPVYVGLVSGFVGLYQLNFVVPRPAPGTFACDGRTVFANVR